MATEHATAIRTDRVTVNGVSTVVREAGPANSSEAVVFLHGHPGSSEDWIDLLPVAGDHARAIAIDLPGFGNADKPDSFSYAIPSYVHYLNELLEELSIRRVHLVLHDFGSFVGLGWALKHPERVASIVLINIGIMPGYRWHFAAKVWRVPVLGELAMFTITRPSFKLSLRLINPRPMPERFMERMYSEFDRDTRRTALQLYRSIDDPGEASHLVGKLLPGERWPVLVVWGDKDIFLPYTYAHRQRQFFPQAEIVIMRDCGHWPFVDEPEQFAATLDQFLSKHLPHQQ